MTNKTPESLFDDVNKFIADSRAILAKGDFVQLEGLDEEVKRLCEAVLQLSQDERIKHADTLQALLANLSELGKEMEAHRDGVAGQVHDLSAHRQAHVAYKVADATDDFGGKKNKKDS